MSGIQINYYYYRNMSGTSKHGFMPEASDEEEGWDAHAATGNEEEGWEADAAATGNVEEGQESEYFEEEGDDTTDGGGTDRTDGGSGGADPTAEKKKKAWAPRKERTPQVLANVTDAITEVSPSGLPLEPQTVASGYSMQIGCIVRESMSINTTDLRSTENKALVETLFKKLHQRYTFPEPFNKKVDTLALTKMSTALSSWRSRVKKKIMEGKSWEEISRKEPTLEKEDFDILKSYVNTEECTKWTEWGRKMRDQNIGVQHCGSGGYRGKQPVWDKEDREIERLGKENPWHKITDL